MSCDSNLFLKNGINILKLVKYIEQKYGKNGEVKYDENNEMRFFNILFNDGEANHHMFVYIYHFETYSETPVPTIPNVSCMIILNLWGNSIEILQDIAKHFGGGYVRDNDCGSDGSNEWYFVEGLKNAPTLTTTQENEIFKFVHNTLNKEEISLDKIQLTRFLINHIDEIKKL